MQIAFFGSSLVSAYWNGAATYYRGMIRALHELGHQIAFYEPDAYERQQHRDIEDPDWAEVIVYPATEEAVRRAMAGARRADVIVKASGVGVFDQLLERELLEWKRPTNLVVFWDVDAPATLDRVHANAYDPFASLIPRYDAIFTYGGGRPVVDAYENLGARTCVPVYNALDTSTHYPVRPDPRFACDVAFLGNRLPDRELRVDEFFFNPARALPEAQFLLGGAGWGDKAKPPNVRYLDHVYTRDHNAFNCTPRLVLNISRESMARYGYSPATRVFEAAGAGACIITDLWEGVDMFFEPGKEILVASGGEAVTRLVQALDMEEARTMGRNARRRVLAEHTYQHRAGQVVAVLEGKASAMVGAEL
jgi:spore maturation protein CgeB